MDQPHAPLDAPNASLETLQDIKRIMERSSRFISLSGLSGVSAGICALAGAYIAHGWILDFFHQEGAGGRGGYVGVDRYGGYASRFVMLAIVVLAAALASSFYFTWRKARRSKLPVWDPTSRKLLINIAIPLGAGGLFILGLVYHMNWEFVAPSCLVFYGLALVNASKYTLKDIRLLGIFEIVLGIMNMYFERYGLYFWAFGFGFLHIVYGLVMWWKYDRGGMA